MLITLQIRKNFQTILILWENSLWKKQDKGHGNEADKRQEKDWAGSSHWEQAPKYQ